jgi:hypothetical protein
MGKSIRRRLIFLSAANVLLLIAIALLLKPGASFAEVLQRIGTDIATVFYVDPQWRLGPVLPPRWRRSYALPRKFGNLRHSRDGAG